MESTAQQSEKRQPVDSGSPLLRFCKGCLIGIGAIIPGISGGVMAVILGLYEDMLRGVIRFFDDVSGNFLYLLPIALGGMVGVLSVGNVLETLFFPYEAQSLMLFSGFVLGNLPWMLMEAGGTKRDFKRSISSYRPSLTAMTPPEIP